MRFMLTSGYADGNPTWTADGAQNANRQTSALVDYRDWTARDGDPQDSSTSWGTGAGASDDRSSSDSGPARPRYSDREYSNHGYWEKEQPQQPDRGYPTSAPDMTPRIDTWPGAGQSTGSWRMDSLPPPPAPAPAPAVTPAGFGFDGDDRDYPAVIWWTLIWYAMPVLIYTLWALTMSAPAMRGHAVHGLLSDVFPGLIAVAFSLGFAAWIRRISLGWRAITLGFGSAAIGAGIATLLVSTV